MSKRELLLKIIEMVGFISLIVSNIGLILSCFSVFNGITSKQAGITHISVIMFSFFLFWGLLSRLFWKNIRKYLE